MFGLEVQLPYLDRQRALDNEGWFDIFYSETYPATYAYALRRIGDRWVTEDVVSETYVVAWRRVVDLREVQQPQLWLYRTAYQTWSNIRRGANRQSQLIAKSTANLVMPPDAIDPSELFDHRERLDEVVAVLRGMSERYQEVVRLAVWEDLSHREIASVLEMAPTIVRTIVYRARRKLNDSITEEESRQRAPSGHLQDEGLPSSGTEDQDDA